MRRRLLAGTLIAVAAGLAACAPTARGDWTPASWSASALEVIEAPAPVEVGAGTGLAPGLTPQRLRHEAVGVQARFAFLPGTDAAVAAFNDAVTGEVRAAIDAQSARSGAAYTPTAAGRGAGLADRACVAGSTVRPAAEVLADPALGPPGGSGTAVVCDVVAAQGAFFGQRMRVVVGDASAVDGDTAVIRYADTSTGETLLAHELWSPDAAAVLSAAVVEALRRDAGSLSLRPASPGDDEQLAAITAALRTTVPVAGGLAVTIAPGFSSLELTALGVEATTEPLTVRIPAAVAAPLLTEFGARLVESEGSPYAGPDAQPVGRSWVDCRLVPCVALTYDDGPSALTPGLLDILRDRGAAATFYVQGAYVGGAPDTVRRTVDEGHELGNHTWSHPRLPTLDDAAVRRQIASTDDAIRAITGTVPATFRPPYGEFTSRVVAAAGKPAILWTVDTRDWAGPSDGQMLSSAIDGATPGGIILFHDTHERSIRVAPGVIDGLLDRGFTLATVTQLFHGTPPTSGAWRAAP